jgi:integrase
VTLRRVPRRPGLYEVRPGTYKLVRYAGKTGDRSKQRSRTFHAASDRAAIKASNGIADELDREIVEATARAGTVNGLCDKWERDRAGGHSPSTIRGGAARLNRIRRDLGHHRLDELNAGTVDGWMTDLRSEGLSPTTVANHYSALRALIRQGVDWDMIPSPRAVEKAKRPKRQAYREGNPPTANAVGVLWETATPDLKVAVALAAWAGLRRGEVMGLRWSDVEPNVLHIRRARVLGKGGVESEKVPKSGKVRQVYVDPWLTDSLLVGHRMALEERAELLGQQLPADGPVLPDLVGHAMAMHPENTYTATGPHNRDDTQAAACQLRAEGMPISQIGKRLGISPTHARRLILAGSPTDDPKHRPHPQRSYDRFKGQPFGTVPRKLDWLSKAWTMHAKRKGAPDVHYHDLRHHYATEMIEAGVPLTALQHQLGHTQLTTTMNVYAHVVDDTRRRAAGVVAARRRIPGTQTPELPAPQ